MLNLYSRFYGVLITIVLLSNTAVADPMSLVVTEELRVKKAFYTYVEAVSNDLGVKAYSSIDKNTRDYYDNIHKLAIYVSKKEFLNLGILDKVQVLMMRHMVPADKLIYMNGEKLFVYAVNQGWVGKNGMSHLNIGQVKVSKNFASGQVVSGGEVTPLQYHFYRENNHWKMDIKNISEWGEKVLAKQQRDSGLSEEEFVFQVLQTISGGQVNAHKLYTPLKV